MSKKILIPYFLAGSGHLVSATAIQHFLKEKRPNWECRLFEPVKELKIEMLEKLFVKSWHFVLKRPATSKVLFYLSEKLFSFISIAINRYVIRRAAPAMRSFLEGYRPDLIITTHWGCGHLAAEAMKTGAPNVPLFVVRNDLGGAYRIQKVDCDLTIVMSSEAVEAFCRLGVPGERMMQANLLVRHQFNRIGAKEPRPEECFRILLSSGGEGLGNIRNTAGAMLQVSDRFGKPIQVDILSGRNESLRRELESALDDNRVTVHGYRDDVDVLMKQADLIVGKCGANYTMECAMLGKPFLITQVGAPSERPNLRYVIDRGFGWHASNRTRLKRVVRSILAEDGFLDAVVTNLESLPEKNGALEIAERVITEVESRLPTNSLVGR